MKICNYEASFPDALAAQGSGTNFLVLWRYNGPRETGGTVFDLNLEHRWLDRPCLHDNDQAPAHEAGGESRYLSSKAYPKLYAEALSGHINLFDYLDLL